MKGQDSKLPGTLSCVSLKHQTYLFSLESAFALKFYHLWSEVVPLLRHIEYSAETEKLSSTLVCSLLLSNTSLMTAAARDFFLKCRLGIQCTQFQRLLQM